jgi:hypothetical protein
MGINTLSAAHKFIREHVFSGDICIDAKMGRGLDTALLCELVGEEGKVLAFDIQQDALNSTAQLLGERGLSERAQLILDSHENMHNYADAGSVSLVDFNLGWLPGGDHTIFTHSASSIAAINRGLELLKVDGVMSICIYYGGASGYEERDALLPFLEMLDDRKYTVIISRFANRKGDVPINVFIFKDM